MPIRTSCLLRLLCGAALALAAAPAAGQVCVDLKKSGCQPTIQGGVDAASPGDTVQVGKGTFVENVVIDRTITLRSSKRTILDADEPNNGPGIVVQADGVTIEGLTVRHGNDVGILVEAGATGTTLRRLTILRPDRDCIDLQDGADDTTIEQASLVGCRRNGVSVGAGGAPPANLMILGTRFDRVGRSAVSGDANGALIENNRIETLAGRSGFELAGDGIVVTRNNIDQVGRHGVDVDGDRPLITGNRVLTSGGDAIRADCPACSGGELSGNSASYPRGDGVRAETTAATVGLLIQRNRVNSTGGDLFDVRSDAGTAGNTVLSNMGKEARRDGVRLLGDAALAENNRVTDVADDGFHVEGDGHVLRRNRALKSLRDGFDVLDDGVGATGNQIESSVSKSNLGVGVVVSLNVDSTLLTRNKAKGNGLGDFCDAGTNTTDSGNRFATTFDPLGGECPVD